MEKRHSLVLIKYFLPVIRRLGQKDQAIAFEGVKAIPVPK
jgi:hypothetical protein